MWGRYYWGKKRSEDEEDDHGGNTMANGIVVVFAWLSSQEKHVKPYIDLYSSLGWSSLICHSQFPTLFFPERAAALANGVIEELVKELKTKPRPVVFSSFSGGPKGCTYKVLQLIDGTCKGRLALDEYKLVRECLCGQIYDSSPVDFKSDFGTKFVLHPSVLNISEPPRVLKWIANGFASSLDYFFIKNFERQRREFWETLYNSSNFGPVHIFCSDNDDLAPYSVIHNFAKALEERGADVSMMKWDVSPHVGHYKYHPEEYRSSVTNLLQKASKLYSNRKQLEGHLTGHLTGRDPLTSTPRPVNSIHRTASSWTNQDSLQSSAEYQENQETKTELFRVRNGTGIEVLLDVCEPKEVEGWELKSGFLLDERSNDPGFVSPIKFGIRSRL